MNVYGWDTKPKKKDRDFTNTLAVFALLVTLYYLLSNGYLNKEYVQANRYTSCIEDMTKHNKIMTFEEINSVCKEYLK